MKKSILVPAGVLLLSVTSCGRIGPVKSYEAMGNTTDAVRAAFNANAGKVRVLMVVSPTCGECLNGASEVSEQVVKIDGGKDVPLYVIWVPRRGGLEKDVPGATRVVADSLAQEYWDGKDLLGQDYRQVLGWRDNAWDVYLLYGPKARWDGDLPPVPDFFMHQTDEKGLFLDASVFGEKIRQLL